MVEPATEPKTEDLQSVIEIAAPREAVWRTLTDPAAVARWMGCVGFQPVVGHIFHLQPDRAQRAKGGLRGAITCRVEVLDAPRRLTFSWGFPETLDTWVEIRLKNIPGGAHVRLTHTGWDQFDPAETEPVRGGLDYAWHAVVLPALKAEAEGG